MQQVSFSTHAFNHFLLESKNFLISPLSLRTKPKLLQP
jgi:hypothetical protein